MALIKGVQVILYEKQQTGVDGFGAPVYTESPITVDNVLICQPSTDAVADSLQVWGKHIAYMLCVPKDDTHKWENCVVEFRGEKFRTFGYPMEYMEHQVPLDWNKQVRVERYG